MRKSSTSQKAPCIKESQYRERKYEPAASVNRVRELEAQLKEISRQLQEKVNKMKYFQSSVIYLSNRITIVYPSVRLLCDTFKM